ncbi:Predicted nucleic acid-binding protein,contains PIN domain (fragment) [Candidatus Methylomirabilis oxygeniifera]|uniref:Predicted nucleic acid-binding protein,contains PIN domain n=1 Tax=Methylomirabilis oxygeniifera TaxID=671143 RepID=D5MLP6_METO1
MPAHHCEFIALAEHLNIPLVTSDAQILAEFPDTAVSLNTFISM